MMLGDTDSRSASLFDLTALGGGRVRGPVVSGAHWLWEAGLSLGVTVDDPAGERAMEAAAACGTLTARVECGSWTLDGGLDRSWKRTGDGWTGRRDAGGVMRWTAFGVVLAEAS
jgi:hypothetical protein